MSLVIALTLMNGAAPVSACFETARDVAAGELLTPDAVRPVDCRASKSGNSLRYDALNGTVIASAMLPAGTYLDRLSGIASSVIPKGARLTLRAVSGPAIVERQVTTLQPGRSGQRVFVIDADGNVSAASLRVDNAEGSAK